MFVLDSFGTDEETYILDREAVLEASGLLQQPDGDEGDRYIIKSGGMEDAAGVIEFTTQFEMANWEDPVNSTCQPFHPYCSIIG